MVQTGMLAAIIFVMGIVPWLGLIPLGFMNLTILHIPVIFGSVLLGPKRGAILGFTFGLASFLSATFNPQLLSIMFTPFAPPVGGFSGGFSSLIICFLPRILTGIIPYYVYVGIVRLLKGKKLSELPAAAFAGIIGSLTNTVLVLGLGNLLLSNAVAAAFTDSGTAMAAEGVFYFFLSVIATNGIPECIAAALIVTALIKIPVFKPIYKYSPKKEKAD